MGLLKIKSNTSLSTLILMIQFSPPCTFAVNLRRGVEDSVIKEEISCDEMLSNGGACAASVRFSSVPKEDKTDDLIIWPPSSDNISRLWDLDMILAPLDPVSFFAGS